MGVVMTDEQRVRVLADALQDVISLSRKVILKGEIRPGKMPAIEAMNYSVQAAYEALEKASIRVRKTGRV